MKKTPLKRKTALKARRPAKRSKIDSKAPKPSTKVKQRKKPTITILKKKLWEECKRIIRERHGLTCYTCGAKCDHPHTGHYIPSSVCSVEMRYSLDNLRPQCFRCNIHLSGNWPAYEAHLIIDHGRDFPEQLKQRNRETIGRQYDILWYTAKLEEYKQL